MDRGATPVSILHALEELPPEAAARFASDATASPFHGAAWFAILAEACATQRQRPFIIASQDGGLIAPLALRQADRVLFLDPDDAAVLVGTPEDLRAHPLFHARYGHAAAEVCGAP